LGKRQDTLCFCKVSNGQGMTQQGSRIDDNLGQDQLEHRDRPNLVLHPAA